MIRIIGDDIEFDRKVVARLEPDVTPTLLDEFKRELLSIEDLKRELEELERELADLQTYG